MTNSSDNRIENASLAGLLRIEDLGDDWSEQDLAAIWRHQLTASIVEQFGPSEGETEESSFADALHAEQPSLDRLQQIKRFAKGQGGLPRELAGVLYLASIGAARVRLGERITESPDDQLRSKLQWAAGRSWLDAATRDLLLAASTAI